MNLQNPFRHAGTLTLAFISIMLIGLVFASIDDWYDNWREYAAETSLSGFCAENPDDSQCDDGGFEAWMLAPWGLTVGALASCLAIAMPVVWYRRLGESD